MKLSKIDWKQGYADGVGVRGEVFEKGTLTLSNCGHANAHKLELRPLFGRNNSGIMVETDESRPFAIDLDRYVGKAVNPKTYPPAMWLPSLMAERLDNVFSGSEFELVSARTWREREVWAFSFALPNLPATVADRAAQWYLNVTRDITKGIKTCAAFMLRMMFCDNQSKAIQFAAEEDDGAIKATKNSVPKLETLLQRIDRQYGVAAQFALALEEAAEVPCDVSRAERIFAGYVTEKDKLSTRARNTVTDLTAQFVRAPGNRGTSLLDVHEAVTYANHYTAADWRETVDTEERARMQWRNEVSPENDERQNRIFRIITQPDLLKATETRGERLLRECVSVS